MTTGHIRFRFREPLPDEPEMLYSEINRRGIEVRKLEGWADGSVGWANRREEVGGAWLATVPDPPLEEFILGDVFQATPISAAEFRKVWETRKGTSVREARGHR